MSKYHKILGIPAGATLIEIKRAYRKKVKLYHPDLNSDLNAEAKFLVVDEAYDYLMGRIKAKVKYKPRTNRAKQRKENYEQARKREEGARKEKSKRYAKINIEELKKEHEAFKNKTQQVQYFLSMVLISVAAAGIAYFLINMPIESFESYLNGEPGYPMKANGFDYSVFLAIFLAMPFLYAVYRVFSDIKTVLKDQ